jgi:hypothetical protein
MGSLGEFEILLGCLCLLVLGFARNDLSPGRIPVENDEKTGKNCEGLWHSYAIESTSILSSSIEQAWPP